MTRFPSNSCLRVSAGLTAKICSGGLNKLHVRQSVNTSDFQTAHQFFGIELVKCTGSDGGIVSENNAFDILDDTNANDEP